MEIEKGSVEELIQEHAIYKQFFNDLVARPRDPGSFTHYWKAKAFDVRERLEKLSLGAPYYDPSWKDADRVLFPLVINKAEN